MKFSRYVIIGSLALMACGSGDQQPAATQEAKAPAACVDNDSTFKYEVESFAERDGFEFDELRDLFFERKRGELGAVFFGFINLDLFFFLLINFVSK